MLYAAVVGLFRLAFVGFTQTNVLGLPLIVVVFANRPVMVGRNGLSDASVPRHHRTRALHATPPTQGQP